MAKKKVAIIATGGTISGVAEDEISSTNYNIGALKISSLIAPNLAKIAEIHAKDFANIDSKDISDDFLLRLAARVKSALNRADGVVITHGTDSMEESAYFLSLALRCEKPVVLTGAMRAASALSADGKRNLFNAVILATDARAKGVFVAMNDTIFAPRSVQKTHTLALNAFAGGEMGAFIDGKARFYGVSNTQSALFFDTARLKTLPKVAILYSHANDEGALAANALFENGVKAFVIVGFGAGSIHKSLKSALQILLQKGAKIVISSRTGGGFVALREEDLACGFISANDLNPQKARILLQLALTKTRENRKIQGFFDW